MNIAENQLVTLDWSEIVGRYNTADTMVEIGPRNWDKTSNQTVNYYYYYWLLGN